MLQTKIMAGVMAALFSLSVLASELASLSQAAEVSSADFNVLAGEGWVGSLRYLDYSSDTQVSIPVKIRFDKPGSRKIVYRIKYPGEAQYNATESIKWSRNGRKLNGETIVDRDLKADGTIILVTQYNGKDNKRPAEIRMTYSLHKSALTIAKDVRFQGEGAFFRRNTYELSR